MKTPICKDCLIVMTPLKSKFVKGLFICQKCKLVK